MNINPHAKVINTYHTSKFSSPLAGVKHKKIETGVPCPYCGEWIDYDKITGTCCKYKHVTTCSSSCRYSVNKDFIINEEDILA